MGTISIGFGISDGEGVSLSLDGSYGIGYGDIVAGGPVLPQWTLGYDGISVYGQLDNAWQPTGADWEIEVTSFSAEGVGSDRYIISQGGFGSALNIYKSASGKARVIDTSVNVEKGDFSITPYLTVLASSSEFDIGAVTETVIGARSSGTVNFWDGQIHLIQLIDNDDPTNSITINNVISSATQPTDFNIYDELTGDVIGSYFNGVYEIVEDGS